MVASRRWSLSIVFVMLVSLFTVGHSLAAHAAPLGRHALWVAPGNASADEIDRAAPHVDVVIMHGDQAHLAWRLKAARPGVTVLRYVDLNSVRRYDGNNAVVSGVSFNHADSTGWIARNQRGGLLEWAPSHAQHYQTTVWRQDYRDQWTRAAVSMVNQGPWDGLFADNILWSLRYYTSDWVGGDPDQAASDRRIEQGTDALVQQAGAAVKGAGKLFIVNTPEARRMPIRWIDQTRFGGGFQEHFTSWSNSGSPNMFDEGPSTWLHDILPVGYGPRTYASTTAASGDTRTCVYGYASFLLMASAGDAWQCDTGARNNYAEIGEPRMNLGEPLGASQRMANGLWTRSFSGGFVAVNPTRGTQRVNVPQGYVLVDGRVPNPDLISGSAMVLRRA